MPEDDRLYEIRTLLFGYVRSPSLRHMRDPYSVSKLAQDILRVVDRGNSAWRKWDGQREALLRSAGPCWVPVEALRDFLNEMPGPKLTATDVRQRLEAFYDDDIRYPDEALKSGCLALYEAEASEGTELPAIIGALREHVELETERRRVAHEAEWREYAKQQRDALEERFLSGADCKWTPVRKSQEVYCRVNGRAFRLSPTKDKKWVLDRITSIEDTSGYQVGRYQYRGDATKVISKVAYEPEPRW